MSDGAKESNGFLLVEVVVGPICHHKGPICHRHYKVWRHRWEDIVFHQLIVIWSNGSGSFSSKLNSCWSLGLCLFFLCLVDKKDQLPGLCFCVWLTRKSKKILENLGVWFLYLNLGLCSLCSCWRWAQILIYVLSFNSIVFFF